MPKYDDAIPLYRKLAEKARRGEAIAGKALPLQHGANTMRRMIRDALRRDGVAGEIDDLCRELLPDHAVQ